MYILNFKVEIFGHALQICATHSIYGSTIVIAVCARVWNDCVCFDVQENEKIKIKYKTFDIENCGNDVRKSINKN